MNQNILAAVVEDYPDWQEKIQKQLAPHHIQVVAKATTLASGLALLPKLHSLGVSVLILDGALDKSSRDGDLIGRACHDIAPDILRIGMSRYLDGVTECDMVVGKENIDDLGETIRSLYQQKDDTS